MSHKNDELISIITEATGHPCKVRYNWSSVQGWYLKTPLCEDEIYLGKSFHAAKKRALTASIFGFVFEGEDNE